MACIWQGNKNSQLGFTLHCRVYRTIMYRSVPAGAPTDGIVKLGLTKSLFWSMDRIDRQIA